MKSFFRIAAFTIGAVVVAACTRYALRRFFPSLYGERRVTQVAIATGTKTVPDIEARPGHGEDIKPATKEEAKESPPYPVGHLWGKQGNTVVMSDGSVLSMAENTEEKPRLQRIARYFVDYEGKRMWYRPNLSLAAKVASASQQTESVGAKSRSGAQRAPVSQDGTQRLGDGPPDEVLPDSPVESRPGGISSMSSRAHVYQQATHPANSNPGSWVAGEDGVQRLVHRAEIGR